MHICNMFPASGRDPPMLSPPSDHTHGDGLAIYDHPSRSHMLYTLPNKIPPCSVHYCLNAQTIYFQRITAHKVPL